MKNIHVKLLLNRIQYDVSKDLEYIKQYFAVRDYGINILWLIEHVDIAGYTVTEVENVMGGYQPVISGAETLVKPFLSSTDDICVLVIEGFKEFGNQCPSECEEKQYIPNTKTIFCCANADDLFYDQTPNFRIWLMHELMHALGTMSNYAGFPVDDCMDVLIAENGKKLFYYLNQTPEDVNSNFTNMFERIYPWLKIQ